MKKKRLLILDRDGTIIEEPPEDFQVDDLSKLKMVDGCIEALKLIAKKELFEFIIVTNQDGLGTTSFPMEDFLPPHNKMLDILEDAGIEISTVLVDMSFPEDNSPSRKPKIGLMKDIIASGEYDLVNSWVIGDRVTDMQMAQNLGSRGILLPSTTQIHSSEELNALKIEVYEVADWEEIPELII